VNDVTGECELATGDFSSYSPPNDVTRDQLFPLYDVSDGNRHSSYCFLCKRAKSGSTVTELEAATPVSCRHTVFEALTLIRLPLHVLTGPDVG